MIVKLQPSRGRFSFFALLNSAVTAPIFTNFTRCRGISVAINPHLQKRCCTLFGNAKTKSENGQFRRLQKASKLIGYHSNVSSTTAKNNFSFIIFIYEPTNGEKLAKFGPVLAEIFGMICRFLSSRPKRCRNSIRDLWG